MLPDYDLRPRSLLIEIGDQRVERLGHVPVAQVPGERRARGTSSGSTPRRSSPAARSARRRKNSSAATHPSRLAYSAARSPQFHTSWLDRFVLARLAQAEARRVAVSLRVLAEVLEARITVTRPPRRLGVDLIEICQDRFNGSKQTVEVEAVEADLPCLIADRVVVVSQPPDEIEHVGVAPHPGGKSLEVAERVIGAGVGARAAHVSVHSISVRPVGFNRDRPEALLDDQPFGNLRALAVKLMRAVRSLAEQHEAGVADHLQQRIVIFACADERLSCICAARQQYHPSGCIRVSFLF